MKQLLINDIYFSANIYLKSSVFKINSNQVRYDPISWTLDEQRNVVLGRMLDIREQLLQMQMGNITGPDPAVIK